MAFGHIIYKHDCALPGVRYHPEMPGLESYF